MAVPGDIAPGVARTAHRKALDTGIAGRPLNRSPLPVDIPARKADQQVAGTAAVMADSTAVNMVAAEADNTAAGSVAPGSLHSIDLHSSRSVSTRRGTGAPESG